MRKQHIFCISDGTGITASTLSQSLQSQFENVHFVQTDMPYVDSAEKARAILDQIRKTAIIEQVDPIVLTTIIQDEIKSIINQAPGLVLDCLQSFIGPLEKHLGVESSHTIGRTHSMSDYDKYKKRIDALNYTLNTDDGANLHQYEKADLILVGVSRCGKTPTSLYLALHHSLFVGNYPITDEDISKNQLPQALRAHKHKLFGLTIDVERLIAIRQERRPNSRYSSPQQCRQELRHVERLLKSERIPYLNSTHLSIEELATRIIATLKLKRAGQGLQVPC
jgi:regulator of PEP synthase PpsR (kinase-PPPase family)